MPVAQVAPRVRAKLRRRRHRRVHHDRSRRRGRSTIVGAIRRSFPEALQPAPRRPRTDRRYRSSAVGQVRGTRCAHTAGASFGRAVRAPSATRTNWPDPLAGQRSRHQLLPQVRCLPIARARSCPRGNARTSTRLVVKLFLKGGPYRTDARSPSMTTPTAPIAARASPSQWRLGLEGSPSTDSWHFRHMMLGLPNDATRRAAVTCSQTF